MTPQNLKNLLPLFMVIFIDSMGLAILFPILNPICMDPLNGIFGAGVSLSTRNLFYGLILCVYPLAMFFAAPVLGEMSDQIGRKKVLLICLLGACASYALSGFAVEIASVWLLIASRIVAGLTAGSQPIAQAAVIDVSTPEEKAKNLSLIMFPACLGFVAGPLAGSFFSQSSVVSWFSLSTPLYFSSLFSLFSAFLLWAWFSETFTHTHKLVLKLHRGVEVFLIAFKNHSIRRLSIIYLCLQLGWACYFQFVSLFLTHRYAYDSVKIGYFMAVLGVGFALGLSVVIRVATKYFSTYVIVLWSFIIASVSIFVTVVPEFAITAWIAALPVAIVMALAYVLVLTLYSNLADIASQGWVMGITASVASLAWAVMAIVSGELENLGQSMPLYTAAIFIGISAIILWFSRKQLS